MPIVKKVSNVYAVYENDEGDIVIKSIETDDNGLSTEFVQIPREDLEDLRFALDEIALKIANQ